MRARRAGVVALIVLACAWAAVIQPPGPNQNAHLALITAITHGTPRIDPYRRWSRDISYFGGHFYTAKAPGLALATLPWYLALRTAGLVVAGPPPTIPWPQAEEQAMSPTAPWEVGLWGSVLAGLVLLLLVRSTVDRFVPGWGVAAAFAVGAGSVAGVLATLFFDHVLSALLGFAAFAVLVRERDGPERLRLVALAGLLAGLAVTVEFPLGIVMVVLLGYVLLRAPRRQRAVAYLTGALAGLVPLGVFNWWAFGSPFRLAYTNAVIEPGKSGHALVGANASGFFGVGVFSPRALLRLLFAGKGLLVVTPVWTVAAVGLVLLWRSGRRAEAGVAGSVAGLFLIYNACYYLPFGGFNAGPRFLVPMMPFLALPLAAAWRRLPVVTTVLAVVSVVTTWVLIAAGPLLVGEDLGVSFHRLERGGDVNGKVPLTVLHWVWDSHRVVQLLLVFVVVAVALVLAALASPRIRFDRRALAAALAALVAWRLVYTAGPILLSAGHALGVVAVAAMVTALAGVVALVRAGSRAAVVALVPLVPMLWARVDGRASACLVATLLSVLVVAALMLQRRRAAGPFSGGPGGALRAGA